MFVAAGGSLPVWVVVAVAFARALGSTLHTPAFNALTPFVAPPEMLTRLAGISQFMQSGGYILGTAIAAVVYPVWGLTAMVALDVAGALLATAAVLASRIDTSTGRAAASAAGNTVAPADAEPVASSIDASAALEGDSRLSGRSVDALSSDAPVADVRVAASVAVEEESAEKPAGSGADASGKPRLTLRATVRAFLSESAEGYRELKRHRGLFALLWIGFAFSVAFSPVSALFPLMTIGHFGGTTTDAAAAEIVFSVGMIAASALIGATGGFRNRGFSCAFATLLFGAATFAAGALPSGAFAVFLALSCVMGFASPLYSSPQVALMQERIPPELLGRVFGLYGAVASWAMPIGLVGTALFADTIGVTLFFVIGGAAMMALAVLTWALPSVRHIDAQRDA